MTEMTDPFNAHRAGEVQEYKDTGTILKEA